MSFEWRDFDDELSAEGIGPDPEATEDRTAEEWEHILAVLAEFGDWQLIKELVGTSVEAQKYLRSRRRVLVCDLQQRGLSQRDIAELLGEPMATIHADMTYVNRQSRDAVDASRSDAATQASNVSSGVSDSSDIPAPDALEDDGSQGKISTTSEMEPLVRPAIASEGWLIRFAGALVRAIRSARE